MRKELPNTNKKPKETEYSMGEEVFEETLARVLRDGHKPVKEVAKTQKKRQKKNPA